MVVDGRPEPEYEDVGQPVFSPDGRHVAYAAKARERWFVVTDGQPGPEWEWVSSPFFAPDSRRLAYFAAEGDEYFVVVNSQRGPAYEECLAWDFHDDGTLEFLGVRGSETYRVRVAPDWPPPP